jgi:predicted nucleic acid-binding protein
VIELADTSAWTARLLDPELDADFALRVERGEIGTCRQVVHEILFTFRDARSFSDAQEGLNELRDFPIRRREWDRAADVMYALLERGRHRSVALPDLLVAAAAESAEVPVLHYDRDFEAIAEITGQPVKALAPLGSL